ncbi:uncharacterized protein LOC110458735 isoform X2 [Mizuhopecten yessoensis]|uniref:uncharacterized protein LOC110458735 isoform X2 n=1 Tax=Mizuhopecten yessoensis TaxID=6573 RepID=UPI000B45857E|nr:uncharacterized protein LOC110458735 isoform X2 [Mizuhopecten yessoensis]
MSARTRIRHWTSRKIDDNLLRQVAPSPKPSTSDETAAHVGCGTSLDQDVGIDCDCSTAKVTTSTNENKDILYNSSDVKIEVDSNELADQQGLCNDLSVNKCKFCEQFFKCYIDLIKHLKDYHVNEPAMDSDAKKSSTSAADGKLVRSYKHKTGMFECEFCERVYKYGYDLNRHVKDAHLKKLKRCRENKKLNEKIKAYVKKYLPFKCKTCGYVYVSQKGLTHHMRQVHSSEAAAKAKCVKEIGDRSKKLLSLISNIKSKTGSNSTKEASEPNSSTKSPALKRNKVMSPKGPSKEKASIKKKTVQPKVPSNGTLLHPKVGLSSPSREKSPLKKASTKFPDKRMHPIEEIHEKSEKKLRCKLCQKIYGTRPGLMYHLKVTHLYCIVCYKQFCYQKIYDKHMEIKHNQRHVVVDDNYFSDLSKASETASGSAPESTKVKPDSPDVKPQIMKSKDCTEKMSASSQNSATKLAVSFISCQSSSLSTNNTVKIPEGTVLSPVKIKLNRLPSDPAALQNFTQKHAVVSTEEPEKHDLESFTKNGLDNKKSNYTNSVVSTGSKDITLTTQLCQDTQKTDIVCEKRTTRSKLGPKSKRKSTRISYGFNATEPKSQPVTVSDKRKVVKLPNETDNCDKELSVKKEDASVNDVQNVRKTRSRLRKADHSKDTTPESVDDGQLKLMEVDSLSGGDLEPSIECSILSSCTEDVTDQSNKNSDTTTVKSSLKSQTSTERITRSSSQPDTKENTHSDGIITKCHSQPERKNSTELSAGSSSPAARGIPFVELVEATDIDPVTQSTKSSSRRPARKDRSSSEPSNSSRLSRKLAKSSDLTSSSQLVHSSRSPSSQLTRKKTTSSEFTPYAHSTKSASVPTTKKYMPSSEPLQSSRKLTNSSKPLTCSSQSGLKDNTSNIPSNISSISTKNYQLLADPTLTSPELASEENTGSEAEDTSHRIEQTIFAEKMSSSRETTRERQEIETPIKHTTLHSRSKADRMSHDHDIRELMFGKSCSARDLHVDDQRSPEHHDDLKWKIVHEEKSYDLNKLTLKITRDVKTDVRSVRTQERFLCNLTGLKLKIVRDFSQQRRTVLSDDDRKCQGESSTGLSDTPQAIHVISSTDGLSSDLEKATSGIQHDTLSALGDNFSSVTSDSDDLTSPRKSDMKDRNHVTCPEKLTPSDSEVRNSPRLTRSGNKSDGKATQLTCSDDTAVYKSPRSTDSVDQDDIHSRKRTISFDFERNLARNSKVDSRETSSGDASSHKRRLSDNDDIKLVRNTGDVSTGSDLATVTNLVRSSGNNIKKKTPCETIVGPAGDRAKTSASNLSMRERTNQGHVEEEVDVVGVQMKASDSEHKEDLQKANLKETHGSDDDSQDISMHQDARLKVLEKSPGKKMEIDIEHHDTDNILTLCSQSFGSLLKHVEERGVAKVLVEKLPDTVTLKEALPNSSLKKRGMSKRNKPAPACVKKQRLVHREPWEKTPSGSCNGVMEESEKHPESEDIIVPSQTPSDTTIDEIDGECIPSPDVKVGYDVLSDNMTDTREKQSDGSGAKVLTGDTIGQQLLKDFDESDLDLLLKDGSCHDLFSDKNGEVTLSDDGLYASVNTPLGDANNNHFKGKVIKEIMEIIQFVEKMENCEIVKSPNRTGETGSMLIAKESKDEQAKSVCSFGQLDHVEKIPKVTNAQVMTESSLAGGHVQQGNNGTDTAFRNINITKKSVCHVGKNERRNPSEENITISEKEKSVTPAESVALNRSSSDGSSLGKRSLENRLLKKDLSLKAGGKTWPPKCRVCGNSFSSEKNLGRHNARFHPEDFRKQRRYSIVCKLCGMIYANKQNLKKHVASKHSETEASSDDAFKLICKEIEIDPDPSSSQNSKEKLKERYDMNIQYRCLLCDITYKNMSSVICHIESSHKRRDKPVRNCYRVENLCDGDSESKAQEAGHSSVGSSGEHLCGGDSESQAQEAGHSSVGSSGEHLCGGDGESQAQEAGHSSIKSSGERLKHQSCNSDPKMDESEAAVHNLLESFGGDASFDTHKSPIQDSDVMNSLNKQQGGAGQHCQGAQLENNAFEEEGQDHHGSQAEDCHGDQQDHKHSEKILHERVGDKKLQHQGEEESKCDGEKEPESRGEGKPERQRNQNEEAACEEGGKDLVTEPLSDPNLDVESSSSETILPESTVQCPPVQEASGCTKEEIHLVQNSADMQQDQQPSRYVCKSDDKICREVADQTGFRIHRNCTVKLVRFPQPSCEMTMGDFLLKSKDSGKAVVGKISTISRNSAPNNLNLPEDVDTRPLEDRKEDEVESRTQIHTVKETENPAKSALTEDQPSRKFVCELCGLTYVAKKGLKRHISNKHSETITKSGETCKVRCEEEIDSNLGTGHFTQIQTIAETTSRKTGKNPDISSVVHEGQAESKKSILGSTDGSMSENTSAKGELVLESDSQPDTPRDKSDSHSDVLKNKFGDHQEVMKEKSKTLPVLESTLTKQSVLEESVECQPSQRKRPKVPKTKKDKEKSKSKLIKVTPSGTPTSSAASSGTSSAITAFEMAISTPAYSQHKLKKRKLDRQTSSEGPPSKQPSSAKSKARLDEKPPGDPEETVSTGTDERYPSHTVEIFPSNMERMHDSNVGDGHAMLWQKDAEFQSGPETTSPRKTESPKKSNKKSIDKIVQGIIQRQKDIENKKTKEKLDPPEVDFPVPFEEILAQSKNKAAKLAELTESTAPFNDDNSNSSGSVKSGKLLTKPVDIFSSLQIGPTVKFGKSFRRASSRTTASSAGGEPQQSFRSPLDRVGVEMPMKFGASQESKKVGEASSKPKQQSNKNYLIDILKDIPSIYDYSNDVGPYVSPWDNPSVSKAGKSVIGGNKPPMGSKNVHFGSEMNDTAAVMSNDDHVMEISNDTTVEIFNEDSDMDISEDGKTDTKQDLLQKSSEFMPEETEEEQKDCISATPYDNDEETQKKSVLPDEENYHNLTIANDEEDSDNDHRNKDRSDHSDDHLSDDGQSNIEEEEETKESDREKEEEEHDFMSPSTPPSKLYEKKFSDEERDILSIDYDSDEASFLGDEDDVRSVISKRSVSKRRSLVAVESELEAVEKSSVAMPAMDQANESSIVHSKIQCNVPSALTPAVVSRAASIFSSWGGYCHHFLLCGNCRRGNACRFKHTIPPLEWFFQQGQATILNSRKTQNKERAFEAYQLLKTLNVRPITRDVVEVLLQLAVHVWDTDAAFQLFGDLKSTDLINNMTSSMLVRLCNSSPQNYTDQLWALFQVVTEKSLKLNGACLDTVVQRYDDNICCNGQLCEVLCV